MLKKLCHDQVKILLERMDTHPEEFVGIRNKKWEEFMPNCSSFQHFTKVEQYLIRRKYCKIRGQLYRQQAYDKILETLVFKKDDHSTDAYTYSTSNTSIFANTATATAHLSASGNLTTNTLTLGSETLDQETIKHMKEHLKALSASRKLGQI
jgi:hypothetical protein